MKLIISWHTIEHEQLSSGNGKRLNMEGCEFESLHKMDDLFGCQVVLLLEKAVNKLKSGWGWPIKKH